jgi:tetratricopeptide (TPR) repeat protein
MEQNSLEHDLAQAEGLYRSRRYWDAIERLSAMLVREPAYEEALYSRGHCWLAVGDFEKALADFIAAQSECGDQWKYLGSIALALYALGKFDEAIENVTCALRFWEDTPQEDLAKLHYHRAMCYLRVGEKALADADFARANELDPAGRFAPRR